MHDIDPEIISKRRKMQMEIILKESDIKKNERAKMDLEVSIHDYKQKLIQYQIEIDTRTNLIKKIEGDNAQLQNEVIKLKHQMNTLGHQQQ